MFIRRAQQAPKKFGTAPMPIFPPTDPHGSAPRRDKAAADPG